MSVWQGEDSLQTASHITQYWAPSSLRLPYFVQNERLQQRNTKQSGLSCENVLLTTSSNERQLTSVRAGVMRCEASTAYPARYPTEQSHALSCQKEWSGGTKGSGCLECVALFAQNFRRHIACGSTFRLTPPVHSDVAALLLCARDLLILYGIGHCHMAARIWSVAARTARFRFFTLRKACASQ